MASYRHTTERQPFVPLPHFPGKINRLLVQSEIDGGVMLSDLPIPAELLVRTENHSYTIVNRGGGRVLISGHPEFCPQPVEVSVHGSTWGGSMIRPGFIGRGMQLEFGAPGGRGRIITSPVVEILEKRRAWERPPKWLTKSELTDGSGSAKLRAVR